MEIVRPHESDGSTTGSKEHEIYSVSDNLSGLGLPYAPEDFPNPGDKWGWKAGKRVNVSGFFSDRYLYLPTRLQTRLQKEYKSRGFASKASVERFVKAAFPGVDIDAFFDSFSWKIPAGNFKGVKESVLVYPNFSPRFDAAGCRAGNIFCSSLLEPSDPHSHVMACDICCIEPCFCRDCCCILCSRTVNSANSDNSFIRCEGIVEGGFVCGHIAHIECGLRSYMAGTVGGTIGLDAEYYCRHCDGRSDLVPHAKNLYLSCESLGSAIKIEKILNICVVILRGSTKTSAKTLLLHVQSALGKLKEGNSLEEIWKREDTSAVTTGELSQCETDTLEVSNFKEPLEREAARPEMLIANFNYQTESLGLVQRVKQTLAALKKAQDGEYRLAEDVLTAQKYHLLDLYKELDKEKGKLVKRSPSPDPSLIDAVFKRMDQIRNEFAKLAAMEAVGKGFGRTSKTVLKEHFGVLTDN